VSARVARRRVAAVPWPSDPSSPFVRPGVRERQRAATRERLFAAAIAELRRRGVAGARVAEIARAAGVSRPSFYAHFPTLDHVLFELAWRLAAQVARRIEPAGGLREALDRLADALIEVERDAGGPLLFRELVGIFARRPALPGIDRAEIPLLPALLRRFERARAVGELRAGMQADRAARLCLAGVFGHLLGVEQPPATRRADLRALFSLYLAGTG
jgi:AcrR family transcriptional regulator